MHIEKTDFPGLVVITPQVFEDERGFFTEFYNRREFERAGIKAVFVQDNHALSRRKGVLRGLHLQIPPAAQAKLVRVTQGSVYDVVVDLRAGSPTRGKWFGTVLSASNFRQMFIPEGFAHGYQVLEKDTEFMYKVSAFYSPEYERGIYFADPDLGIDWPLTDPILSGKDKGLPTYHEFNSPFAWGGARA
ncbi:MAG: dTDP-4-dehydrorhamnose 3,5-epimerase [Desulfonatronovibrionaceae bacterium]